MSVLAKTGVVVLSAGASRRMGRPKAALSWYGNSLLGQALQPARRLGSPVHVVVGSHYPLVRFRCPVQPDRWVYNPHWPSGMASSLQAGLASMPRHVGGAIVLLVDQPLIEACFWPGLTQAIERGAGQQPVAADLGGLAGAPAYLPRWLWPELMALEGDQGAGRVLRRDGVVTVPAPGALDDVDTQADWRALRQSANGPPVASEQA